jgi:hypothetical protein
MRVRRWLVFSVVILVGCSASGLALAQALQGVNSVQGSNLMLGAGGQVYMAISTNGVVAIGTSVAIGFPATVASGPLYTGVLNVTPAAVGIGSSSPQATLDVEGSVYTSGNVGIGTAAPKAAGSSITQVALNVNGAIQTGGATTGSSCPTEGAIAYDLGAHQVLYCDKVGQWASAALWGSNPLIQCMGTPGIILWV